MELHATSIAEIMHNLRIKTYPDGTQEYLLCRNPVFREPGWELSDKWEQLSISDNAEDVLSEQDNTYRAQRRARNAVRDYAYSNEFKYFVTLTLDASKVDRYDIGAVTKKLNTWLDNCVRRKGLKYVLVPERHKDGAIHFHGFINDALELRDSGTIENGGKPKKLKSEKARKAALEAGGHIVYNLPGFKLGFTTAIELYGDYHAAVGYVCKYVTKQTEKIGGRWYYSGGDLRKPEVSYADADYDQFISEYSEPDYTFIAAGTEFAGFRKDVEN